MTYLTEATFSWHPTCNYPGSTHTSLWTDRWASAGPGPPAVRSHQLRVHTARAWRPTPACCNRRGKSHSTAPCSLPCLCRWRPRLLPEESSVGTEHHRLAQLPVGKGAHPALPFCKDGIAHRWIPLRDQLTENWISILKFVPSRPHSVADFFVYVCPNQHPELWMHAAFGWAPGK